MEFFKEINEYPDAFSGANALQRLTEGLGFRYYWGTEDLSESDLSYAAGNDNRNMYETLDHIRYMAVFIANTLEGKQTSFPEPTSGLPFPELRKETLDKLILIRNLFASTTDEDLAAQKIKILANGNSLETAIWHLINGPVLDLGYHIGQIIMMRRSNGNPINPKVQPFFCKKME